MPDTAIGNLLHFISSLFLALSSRNQYFASISDHFPKNVALLWKLLKYDRNNFIKYVVCPECCKLYNYNDCYTIIRGQKVTRQCTFRPFPNHRRRQFRRPCGANLLKLARSPSGNNVLIPHKVYCYRSIRESLGQLVKREGFEDSCEKWR